MTRDNARESVFKRYWWMWAGALAFVALGSASVTIQNTDGWLVVTNTSNTSYTLNFNTTRPAVCPAGNYSYWTGSNFLCRSDVSGGGSGSDGNNFTTSIAFTGSTLKTLTLQRSGMVDLTASFTDLFENYTADIALLNTSIQLLNESKLNATDQRFNNTAAVNAVSALAETKSATSACSSLSNATHTGVVQATTNTSATCVAVATNPGGGGAPTLPFFTNYTTVLHQTTVNTSWVAMPNLTVTLNANTRYSVNCLFLTFSAAATTGEQLQVNLTGTPTAVQFAYDSPQSATTIQALASNSTTQNLFLDLGSAGTNVRSITQLYGRVWTSGSASTLTYFMKSEISGSNAVYDVGSRCTYESY